MQLKQQLLKSYQQVRQQTEVICQPLMVEDYVIQSIEEVSPPKWHLAHTTWFFETFILLSQKKYQIFHPIFQYLFNSYYHTLSSPYPRRHRGLLARPTVKTIYQYRKHVDEHMIDYITHLADDALIALAYNLTLGLHHEQQHQELLLMDIKHNFSLDPTYPVYHTNKNTHSVPSSKFIEWMQTEGGIVEIGNQGKEFCFDNELPQHKIILKPYSLANRLVTNEEYLEFIDAGGYNHAKYWLSDGWDEVQKNHWTSPLYWLKRDNTWDIFTLSGLHTLNPAEPVSHVSYYEADAYARFRGLRLPLEGEWEHFVVSQQLSQRNGNFLEENILHPSALNEKNSEYQLFGDVWEWTASSYSSYPGYKAAEGPLGEYNGKFMSNQFVLRGGSCLTPCAHIRASYRNFFQPDKRWQVSGIRLADDG